VTNVPPSPPMTRRELRQLEEQAQAGSIAPTPSGEPAPVVYQAPPAPTPPAPPPAPAPLSRRERRALDEQNQQMSSPGAYVAPAPFSQPVPIQEPLPPVFSAPVVTQPVFTQPFVAGVVPTDTAPAPMPMRTVGQVSTATSSLILPSTPLVDMTSPLSNTGEVIVTGQITLPPRVSEQGSGPLLDSTPDNDEVMDAYVTGELAAMSKPVRASQAVSGKGDDTDILLVRKARWGTAAIVTILVAGALGLAAVGLLLLAWFTYVMG